jgi:hypothetical protein
LIEEKKSKITTSNGIVVAKGRVAKWKVFFLNDLAHHQPHCHASTIDLIFSSISDSLRSTTQFSCPGISHHDFVGASFEISHIRQPMTFTQRSFRIIDQSALLAAAAYLPWDSIGSLPNADLKVLRLNSLLVALLDHFAPLRTYNRREANSLTWFDDSVLSAIQGRIRAYSSYWSSGSLIAPTWFTSLIVLSLRVILSHFLVLIRYVSRLHSER